MHVKEKIGEISNSKELVTKMLKDKIFNLVKEKFEDILKDEINNRFEPFEVNLEEDRDVQGRDGFIPFVNGFMCLSAVINSSDLISSGNTPDYLKKYINWRFSL